MDRKYYRISFLSTLLFMTMIGGAAADQPKLSWPKLPEPKTAYRIKPSEVSPPKDIPLGQYQRVTRPFPNWTMICDEDLTKNRKVCNISQTIIDKDGNTVFSWSLAATTNGEPFFILRVPKKAGDQHALQIDPLDKGSIIKVLIRGCDDNLCLAYQSVGPRLRQAIEKDGNIMISYYDESANEMVSLRLPLTGLNSAVGAI